MACFSLAMFYGRRRWECVIISPAVYNQWGFSRPGDALLASPPFGCNITGPTYEFLRRSWGCGDDRVLNTNHHSLHQHTKHQSLNVKHQTPTTHQHQNTSFHTWNNQALDEAPKTPNLFLSQKERGYCCTTIFFWGGSKKNMTGGRKNPGNSEDRSSLEKFQYSSSTSHPKKNGFFFLMRA